MAKLLILTCAVLIGCSQAFPSRFHHRNLKPRSIPDGKENQGLEGPPKEDLEGAPKDLLNGPKDLPPGAYGPKGTPKYGPGGPESLPGGPFGPMEFNPEGCMDKRCNPFRSRRPGYRAFLKELRRGRHGGPMGGPMYGPPGPPPMQGLPVMTEIVIIRKIPLMLSKLLVAVAMKADKLPGETKPDAPLKPGREPIPAPSVEYEEEIQPQDQAAPKKPYGEDKYSPKDYPKKPYGQQEDKYGKEYPKKPEDDKDFEKALGQEEDVARSYGAEKAKDQYSKENKKYNEASLQAKKETRLKYDEKEYLEKPSDASKVAWEGANELEPRGNELSAAKDKANGPKY